MRKLALVSATLLTIGFPLDGFASGVLNSENGAAAVGMADAFVAIADDPTAVYYNPAAMTKFDGTAFAIGVSPMKPLAKFTADEDLPGGVAADQIELKKGAVSQGANPVSPLPHLYVINEVEDTPLTVGLGLYLPYATGLAWKDDWVGRGFSTKTQVTGFAFNPNVAMEITPDLSLAVGFSLIQAALEAKQVLRANVGNPTEDIGVHLGAEGQAYAGNAALLWAPSELISAGASYRSAVKADLTGRVDFTTPNGAFAETFPDGNVNTTFRFPDTVNAGVGIFPRDDLKFDAEIDFARNNVNQELVVNLEQKKPASQIRQLTKWHNTVAYRLGGNYIASSRWDFRAGVAWDPTPIPDETVSPSSADSNRFIVATGTSYHWHRHVVSLGAQLQTFGDRTVTPEDVKNGAPDLVGTYNTKLFIASLTYSLTLP
jgi:long-chain fatty acid transport protein